MTIPKYRYDEAYGTLYEYSEENECYLFACSNPFDLSERALIKSYEEECSQPCEQCGCSGSECECFDGEDDDEEE